MRKTSPFYCAKGSDQDAPMKGDHPQQVVASTAPGTKVKRPVPVKSGGAYASGKSGSAYRLPVEKRRGPRA
jgi:uncharacterized protein YfaQ (DUF2300 family)